MVLSGETVSSGLALTIFLGHHSQDRSEVIDFCLHSELRPLNWFEVAKHLRLLFYFIWSLPPLVYRRLQVTVRLSLTHPFVSSQPLVGHSGHLKNL